MPTAALDAAPLNASLGLHYLTENTISGGSGVLMYGGLQNTITKNVIKNATGSNPGVSVNNLTTGAFISQNSFEGNGGNAIDLNTDGVSDNSLVNCLTLSPELVGLANLGIARPNVTNARLQGSTLTVNINYCAIGIFDVEDIHTTKCGASAFFPGKCDLDHILQQKGIKSIFIVGAVTNVCCEASARDAAELEYKVTLISDALWGHGNGLHEATLATFFRNYGDVRPSHEVMQLIEPS